MTIQEASERYQIPMHILREYESWGLCGAVKSVMGVWQYDDTDLERLSTIMTLHDIGFTTGEVETYMRLLLEGVSRLLLTYRESWISQYGTLHSSCTMMILMTLKN